MNYKNSITFSKNILKDFKQNYSKTVSNFTKTEKFLFCSFHLLLSLYITLTQVTLVVFSLIPHAVLGLISLATFVVVYIGLFYLSDFISKKPIYYNAKAKPFDFKFAIIVFLLTEFIVLLAFLVVYPGQTTTDVNAQWMQVQTLAIDDWHPAIHTLTMLLATKIFNSYSLVVFLQCVLFGILVAYLLSTLKRYGFSKKLVYFVLAFLLINKNNNIIMTVALKDSAFSLSVLFLSTLLIHIYLTDGEWLKKPLNIALFSVVTAYTTMVRHNALLFTVAALIMLVILFKKYRKQALCCIAITLVVIGLIRGPLYSSFDVTYRENQTGLETIGLPMTILCDIMVTNPNALDPETKNFLNQATSDQGWIDGYTKGNFNSVKFRTDFVHIWAFTPTEDILMMTYRSILNATTIAINAVIELTDMVWKTTGEPEGMLHITGHFAEYQSQYETGVEIPQSVITSATNLYTAIFSLVPNYVTEALSFIGLHFLAIMLFSFFACKQKGMKALLLVLPVILYNIGTMAVLCGNDYRFFHYNLLISAAFVVVFLAKRKNNS